MDILTLSVIIPNYNKSLYIVRCLESVLNQSYKPFEIIVVDDKSTDDSRELISKLAEANPVIKPLFLDENGGVSNARNMGLRSAKGEYVTFLDSDDYYYNINKLRNEMTLISNEGSDTAVAYSRTLLVDNEGVFIQKAYNVKFKKNDFITGKDFALMLSMAKRNRVPRDYCVSKKFIMSVGAYSFYKNYFEDLDLLMRLSANKANFLCTYEIGTAYRQVPGGLSRRSKNESKGTMKEIRNKYKGLLTKKEKRRYYKLRLIAFLEEIKLHITRMSSAIYRRIQKIWQDYR